MGTADAGRSLIALIASKAIRPVMVELISLAGVLPPGLLVVGVFLSVRGLSSVGSALKRWCTVWVAATSDEVHLTQGLLEAQDDSQRLGKRGNREWGKTQSLLRCK